MKVINREERLKLFFGFLVGFCVIVGGILIVVVVVDCVLFEGGMKFKKLRFKDL